MYPIVDQPMTVLDLIAILFSLVNLDIDCIYTVCVRMLMYNDVDLDIVLTM